MLTLKEQAEVCRIGLITELLSQRDVTAWADHIIETHDMPRSAVIEISLLGSSDLPALVSALFEFQGDADQETIVNVVLGLCAKKLRRGDLNKHQAAAILDKLSPDMSCRRCNIRAEYATLVDPQTASIIRAISEESDPTKEIVSFLAPYAVYAKEILFESDTP
jgi:hypothetical protein